MHAILLAAGVGERLTEVTGGGPKCLLPFAGASLLERHISILAACGVERLTVVTGCEAMQIQQMLGAAVPARAPAMTVTTRQNPDFRRGSAISVLAAHEAMTSGEPVLLMDADVLYDVRIMQLLMSSRDANAVLLDRGVSADEPEPVKVCLRNGQLVGFDKKLPADLAYDTIGESVGFFRLEPAMAEMLLAACERHRTADPDAPHEHALRDVMLSHPDVFGPVDVTGLPWIEIDYPEDVDRARELVVPRLGDMEIAHG